MRIAIFTDSYPPDVKNGVSYAVQWQVSALAKRGHQVRVYTLGKENYRYSDPYGAIITVLRAPIIKPSFPLRFRLSVKYRKIIKEIRDFNPHIIHAHSQFRMSYLGYMAAQKTNVPFIMTFHTFFSDFVKYNFQKGFEKGFLSFLTKTSWQRKLFCSIVDFGSKAIYALYKLADLLIVPSLETKEYLIEKLLFPPDKVIFIPHFMPSTTLTSMIQNKRNKINSNYSNKKIVLHVGRLSKEKRVDVILKAISAIRDRNFQLVITSDGPERASLLRLTEKLGIKENVTFTGFIPEDELLELYRCCKVFVTAAVYDTFNLATAQALAMNKPVIISNLNPQKDHIKEGINGSIIDFNNNNEIIEYANAIKTWLYKNNIKINNTRYVQLLDESNVIPKLLKTYQNAILQKKSNSLKKKVSRFLSKFFYLIITFFMYLSLKISRQLTWG